jgi:hypothetical protein
VNEAAARCRDDPWLDGWIGDSAVIEREDRSDKANFPVHLDFKNPTIHSTSLTGTIRFCMGA